MRTDRAKDQCRSIQITNHYLIHPEGSVLVEFGKTKVICTASTDDDVPPFLKKSGTGWVSAEYSMLPRATNTRTKRERQKLSGRTSEIQRIIGRALRSVVDFSVLGERSVLIDCDVIQADGGTRTAAITGGFVAMVQAFIKLQEMGKIKKIPLRDYVAAMSVGIIRGEVYLDLEYTEDSKADVDMNLVMTGSGKLVEVQGTAEKTPYSQKDLMNMLDIGWKGIESLIQIQKNVLKI